MDLKIQYIRQLTHHSSEPNDQRLLKQLQAQSAAQDERDRDEPPGPAAN